MKRRILAILTTFSIFCTSYVVTSAATPYTGEVLSAEQVENISTIAVQENRNIVITDLDGYTLGEYHADGYVAEFVYNESSTRTSIGEKTLRYIEDNNGIVQAFSLDDNNNIEQIDIYKNGEYICTKDFVSDDVNTSQFDDNVAPASSTFYVYHSNGTSTNMSTLIDDDEFEFCTSCASIEKIQQIFEDNNSPLQYTIDNYIYDGNTVYKSGTCSPAQYIHDICIQMDLSPKLILATLQKESSLVSSYHINSSYSSSCFYFCMGNGSSSSSSSTGFRNQIMGGATTLRYWFGQGSHFSYPYTYTHSGFRGYHGYGYSGYDTSITVTNAGTFSLYKYTPYTCYSNSNTHSCNVLFKDIFYSTSGVLANCPT